jgi:hypothetical protein
MLAVAIKDGIRAVVQDPKNSTNNSTRSAYQIARLIRNSFTHAPFSPTWSVDPDCRNQLFTIPDIITLDTTQLHGLAFDWRHYGGPLALFRMSQFVRTQILGHKRGPRNIVPIPRSAFYQMGNLVLTRGKLATSRRKARIPKLPDGSIPLGDGYFLHPPKKE